MEKRKCGLLPRELLQQLAVDAAEAAVAEDDGDVAALDVLRNGRNDGIHGR